jgi:AcrR family transcriptional regulator
MKRQSSFQLFRRMATDIESRREAILTAMVRVVGRKGYEATSVADVIEEAGTSRTTFYKHFDDKHDCFLAAYERMVDQVFATIVAECDGERPWVSRVRKGLETLIEIFALEPELARTAVVEVAAAGADARKLHWDAVNRFKGYLEAGRELEPGKELPEQISVMAVGAVSGLIFDELIAGRGEQLPELMPDLLFAMLVPYLGPAAAADEMRRAAQAA